jgi:N-acyl-D-aspartate/D-glutamate deacylase
MSSLPAEALGLGDRGTITSGKRADLVLFNSESIHDRSTPTAMARHPEGIQAVVVNGTVAFDGHAVSNSMAGTHVG